MTTYEGSARWSWPIWVLCLGYSVLGLALAANMQWPIVSVPDHAALLAACALAGLGALSALLWVYLAVLRPLKKFQNRCHAPDALGSHFPAQTGGLSGALNGCASALISHLVEVSDADLSDGVHAVKLRFSGDAAARLEALASSVEASDQWLRQRQSTLTQLFTQVATQAASAAQDVQALAQAQRTQQGDVSRCIDETALAVKGLNTLVHQWREVDFKAANDTHKRMEINADALTDATAMLLNQADHARSAADTLNQAARQVDHARNDFSGVLQSGTQTFKDGAQQLRAAGEEVTEAAAQVGTFVAGGRQAIVRSLKAILQSKAACEQAGSALAGETQSLSAQATALARAGGEVEAISAALHQDIQQAAQQMAGDARSAVDEQMKTLSQASAEHAQILARETQSIADFSDTIAMARSTLQPMASALSALPSDAAEAIADFQAELARLRERMDPAEQAAGAIAALKIDEIGEALDGIKAFAQALPDLHAALASPQNEAVLSRLEDAQSALMAQLEEAKAETLSAVTAAHSGMGAALEVIDTQVRKPGVDQAQIAGAVLAALEQRGLSDLKGQLAALETQLIDQLSGAAQAMTAAQADAAGSQSEARAALKAQLRKLSQDIYKQHRDVLAQLKHMRSSQFQTLKHAVRAVPQAVSVQLEDGLAQDVKSMQMRLETLITEALAEQSPAGGPAVCLERAYEREPADQADDLAGRLTAALETMEQIDAEVTALATAALAAPDMAGQSDAFNATLKAAETALNSWGGTLENVSTALALACDAA